MRIGVIGMFLMLFIWDLLGDFKWFVKWVNWVFSNKNSTFILTNRLFSALFNTDIFNVSAGITHTKLFCTPYVSSSFWLGEHLENPNPLSVGQTLILIKTIFWGIWAWRFWRSPKNCIHVCWVSGVESIKGSRENW